MRPAIEGPERGSGLVDVVIFAMLVMLLMAGLYSLVVAGLRSSYKVRLFASAQQEVAVGMGALTRELGDSHPASVSFAGPPTPYCIFLSAQPLLQSGQPFQSDSTGALLWQKWVAYYLSGSSELIRAEIPLGGPLSQLIPEPSPLPLAAFQAVPPSQSRAVARSITSFEVRQGGTADTMQVALASRLETASDKFTEVRLESLVRITN